MSIRDLHDIDFIAHPRPFGDGLLAMLGERHGATRGILPVGEGGSAPAPKPAPKPKPKPKPAPAPAPPSNPTPVTSTPTRSTDQASQGAAVTRNPPPAVTKPKVKHKPAVDNAPPNVDTPPRNTDKPEKPAKKGKEDDKRGDRDGNDTPPVGADDRRTPAVSRSGDSTPPAVDIDSPAFIQQMKVDAAQTRLKLMAREERRQERIAARDESAPDVDIESPEFITRMKIDAAQDRIKAAERAERRDDAKNLDKRYTAEEVAEFQAQQDRLRKREQRIREQNAPDQTEQVQDVAPRNRFFAEEAAQLDATTRATRKEEIKALREKYFANHEVWVDADGTVYQASVNENGRIVGVRERTTPAGQDSPAIEETRTLSIGVMNHRFDTNRSETVPTGTPGEINKVRIERVHTGPRGKVLGSSLTASEEQERKDGSVKRTRNHEEYDERGRPTKLEQRSALVGSDGKVVMREGQDTFFRENGKVDHTVYSNTTFNGGDTGERRVHLEATTYYRADGITPRHEMVVEDGWDANENEPLTTYTSTDFNKSGDPLTTFVRREAYARDGYGQGDGGELPEGVQWREYTQWDPRTGEVLNKAEGGSGLSEIDFVAFIKDGTKPETEDVDQGDIDDLKDSLEENQEHLEQLENGGGYNGSGGRGYSGSSAYGQSGPTDQIKDLRDTIAAQEAELEELESTQQYAIDHEIDSVDMSLEPGSEEAKRYVRTTQNGDDGRWDRTGLGFELQEPLEPSSTTPSVFEVPAMLQASSRSAALDTSKYETNPAARERLIQEQAGYEKQLRGATTDAQRERIMRDYFSTHDYWVDRGSDVLMASGWSEGSPQSSSVFGAERQADPHGVLARTGIQGQDDQGNAATIDVLKNLYVDGSRDELVQTSYDGPGGASRVSVLGEHVNARGVITEREGTVESTIPRQRQGKGPLAITELVRERFNERTGLPQGEQYAAVATSDDATTSLEEQRDYYDTKGVIFDRKIESTQMTRTFDEGTTRAFLDANAAVLEQAARGEDHFNPDDPDHDSIDIPPVGSSWSHSETDVDFDAKGRAIYAKTDEESLRVVASDMDADTNDNGVKVIETKGGYTYGTPGGTTPIYDKRDRPIVDKVSTTTITTSEFDPDDGTAGGDGNENNQLREITSITIGETRSPDGAVTKKWATPYQTETLMEGSDDDWAFKRKYLETGTDLKSDAPFHLVDEDGKPLKDGDDPVELGEGDTVLDKYGQPVVKEHDGIDHQSVENWDEFEEFMGGWGGKIVGGVAIVAGIAGTVFTFGTSNVLTAIGVGLITASAVAAGTSAAAAVTNYAQGEGSLLDASLAVAGTVTLGVGAVLAKGARAAAIANAARTSTSGTSLVSTGVDDAIRAASASTRASVARTTAVSDVGLDGYDVYEATRAAMQGQFYGAGLVLLAGLGGVAAPRLATKINNRTGGPSGTPDVPAIEGGGANGAPDLTPAPLGPDGVPDITDGTLPRDRSNDGNDQGGDGQQNGTDVPAVREANGAIPLPGPRGRQDDSVSQPSDVDGAAGAPAAPSARPRIRGGRPTPPPGQVNIPPDGTMVVPGPGTGGVRPTGADRYSRVVPEPPIAQNRLNGGHGLQIPPRDIIGASVPLSGNSGFQATIVDTVTLADGTRGAVVSYGSDLQFDLAAIRAVNPRVPANATPQSLAGQTVVMNVGGSARAYVVNADGTLVDIDASRVLLTESELGRMGLPTGNPIADIAYRQQREPSFDGTNALAHQVAANPDALVGATVRARHSFESIGANRALHRSSDGWNVAGYTRNANGEVTFVIEQRNPQNPAEVSQRTISPRELVSLNRARIEGDRGQLSQVVYEVDGVSYTDAAAAARALNSDAPLRAQQWNTAFHDWYYATHNRPPYGARDQRIVFSRDADALGDNASHNAFGQMVIGPGISTRGAAYAPGVLAHENGHAVVFDATGALQPLRNTEAGAAHEALGDFYGAAFAGDWRTELGMSINGNGSRDVTTGTGLVQHYDQYQQAGARDARAGVEEHEGSGPLSMGLFSIQQRIGWDDSTVLVDATINDPAVHGDLNLRTVSDGLRRHALQRWGAQDPRTQAVFESLHARGLVPRPAVGESVSIMRADGRVERDAFGAAEYRVGAWQFDGRVLVGRPDPVTGQMRTEAVDPRELVWGDSRNANDLVASTNPYPNRHGHAHAHARTAGPDGAPAGLGVVDASGRFVPNTQLQAISDSVQARIPQGRLWGPDAVETRAHIERRHTFAGRIGAFGRDTIHFETDANTLRAGGIDAQVARATIDFNQRGGTFARGISTPEMEAMIQRAAAEGTWVPSSFDPEFAEVYLRFEQPIGYDSNLKFRRAEDGRVVPRGQSQTKFETPWLKVVVGPDGRLVTAMPVREVDAHGAMSPPARQDASNLPAARPPTTVATRPWSTLETRPVEELAGAQPGVEIPASQMTVDGEVLSVTDQVMRPLGSRVRERMANLTPVSVATAIVRAPLMTPAAMNAAIQAQAQIDRERLVLERKLRELQQLLASVAGIGGGYVQQ